MKSFVPHLALPAAFVLFVATLLISPGPLTAQAPWPYPPPPAPPVPTTPGAQRNGLNNVRSQVDWLQNATRTAPNYATGGPDIVWQQFQMLRGAFNTLKMTLNQGQLTSGANELAELDAGLDILQEAFGYYQNDLAAGRTAAVALTDMCQVLREASGVWLQQLNRDSARLRIGW